MFVYKLMGAVAAIGAVCFGLAATLGNHDHGVRGAFETIGWFGFLFSVLALVALALVTLGRGVYRRASTA